MSSVEDRVVAMKFDYRQFAEGALRTIAMLGKLKAALDMGKQQRSLADLSAESKRFNMGNLGTQVEGVSAKFLALATIGVTALTRITNAAIDTGLAMGKSLTIAPVSSGFGEYELKLGSIQTIMAGSGEDLQTVNKYLGELNQYADRTIYSFANMTQNIGKFTNAGVSLKDSVAAIQGIANVAAISGANAEEASRAMYNFAQALSSGSVKLLDWKSIELANMGTVEFKQQLIDAAVAMGTLTKTSDGYKTKAGNVLTATKGFNESLADQWLQTKVLTNTLKDYADETTKIGKRATAAAQDVKTFSQLIDTLREAAGSGWAETWELVFGNFDESKALWTRANNFFSTMIGNSADARNHILKDWKELGGRNQLIEGFVQAGKAIAGVLGPIRDAFHDIFPPQNAATLYALTVRFREFMEALTPSEQTMENIKRTARGVFALFDIGRMIVKGVVGVFTDLFTAFSNGDGGFLNFTGSVGDLIVKIRDALKYGEGFNKFFEVLGKLIAKPAKAMGEFLGLMGDVFSPDNNNVIGGTADSIDRLVDAMSPLERLTVGIDKGWDIFLAALGNVGDWIRKFVPKISDASASIASAFEQAFTGQNFDRTLDAINTGLLGVLTLTFRQFLSKGINFDVGGGMLEGVGGMLDMLTGHMQAMTQQVKAKTLLMIAGAIAVLTGSVVILSLIDSEALAKSLGAMVATFAMLLTSMLIITKMTGLGGFAKIPAVATALVLLSGAILILSVALKIMATMSWEEMAKGLLTLAATLGILVAAALPLSKMKGSFVRIAISIGILAGSLLILAGALKAFATMSWEEMGKGMTALAGSLVIIAGAMRLMPKSLPLTAAGLVLLGIGMTSIAGAMKIFATMSWEEMGKGFTGVAGGIAAIALAMKLMPLTLPITAAGLVLIGIALAEIGGAMKIFAMMNWEEIGKGIAVVAATLLSIALAVNLMPVTLPIIAAGILILATALAVLTPVLIAMGNMSWGEIIKAFVTLTGVFVLLAGAALLLTPVIGVLAALGAVIALIGLGIGAAGAGILAFTLALSALVAMGTAGVTILTAVIGAIIELIPAFIENFAEGLIRLVEVIGNNTPRIVAAMVKIMIAILDAVIKTAPKMGEAFVVLLDTGLKVLVAAIPKMVNAGIDLILGVLRGIRDRIGEMATVVTEIIAEFIKAWGKNVPTIIDAGIQAMIDFINGLANSIRSHSGEVGSAIQNLTDAFVDLGKQVVQGFIKGLADSVGLGKIADAAGGLVSAAEGGVKLVGKIFSPSRLFMQLGKYLNQGFALGLRDTADIQDALNKMKELIKGTRDDVNEEIEKQKKKIEDLNSRTRTKANSAGIDKGLAEANKALKEAEALKKRITATNKLYNQGLKDEKNKLLALSVQYEDVTKRLEAANDALEDATRQRDDFQKSIHDQFFDLPEIDEEQTLDKYSDSIRDATAKNLKFQATLQKLRELGLDDLTYKKFLEEGVGAQTFLDDLLAAGKTQVDEIDRITAELDKSAQGLGVQTSRELYQAGVNAAQGIVDGLASQQLVIEGQMDKIAKAMVASIKKQLGIKSPSKVFEEIAKFSMDGLSGGFKKFGDMGVLAAADVGDLAMQAMKDSLAQLSDILPTEIDADPTIRPVLDLSEFQRSAAQIGNILAPRDVKVNVSYNQASVLALETAATKKAQDEFIEQALVQGDTLQYIQNNYSPKALTDAEIYRQTKNQLSVVKGALPK